PPDSWRVILIKSIEFWALEILGRVFGYRTEEIGREVAKLHDLPRIFGETELLTHLLAALRMPIGVEPSCRRYKQSGEGQTSQTFSSHSTTTTIVQGL